MVRGVSRKTFILAKVQIMCFILFWYLNWKPEYRQSSVSSSPPPLYKKPFPEPSELSEPSHDNDRRIVQKRCLRRRSDLSIKANCDGESFRKARPFTDRRKHPAIAVEAFLSYASVSRESKGNRSLWFLYFFVFFDGLYCRIHRMVFGNGEIAAGSDQIRHVLPYLHSRRLVFAGNFINLFYFGFLSLKIRF